MAFDHREGAAAANPYAAVMGRTFVGLDETAEMTIIDPFRAEILAAWVARIIPGNDDWPSADQLDTVGYIDATIRKAVELRPVVLLGIDIVDAAARDEHGAPFPSLGGAEQDLILRDAESATAPEAFSMILELTYEAYYRAPSVQTIVKSRTGFDMRNTVEGKEMEPFPLERLEQIASRPENFRSVPA